MLRRSFLTGGAVSALAGIAHAQSLGRVRMARRGPGGGGPPPTDLTPTVSLAAGERRLLGLAALATVPVGNGVELVSVAGSGKLNLVTSPVYRDGDVMLGVGPAWNGTAGSGWTSWVEDGNARTMPPDKSQAQGNGVGALGDQTRTTAKPIARLVTPPFERIAGPKTIVIVAYAKGGIANVRVGCEGAYVDLTTPKLYYYQDRKLRWAQVEGYCVTLDHPAMLAQHASGNAVDLYVRITANDGTMQTRLLGAGATNNHKIRFYPEATPHAHRIELTPSAAPANFPGAVYPSPRARFQTLDDCLNFVKGRATQGFTLSGGSPSCEIVCTETTTQDVTDFDAESLAAHPYHHPAGGYIDVRGAAGTLLTITCSNANSSTKRWQPRVSGLRACENVKFMRTGGLYLRPYLSTSATVMTHPDVKPFGFDSCEVWTDRDYQEQLLDNGRVAGNEESFTTYDGTYGGGWYWATDVVSRNTGWPNCSMVRNCRVSDVIGDQFSYSWAVVGNVCRQMNKSVLDSGSAVPSFSLTYAGAAAYARAVATGSTDKVSLQTSADGASWVTVQEYSCVTYQRAHQMVAAINADTATHGFTATKLVTTGDNFTDRNLQGMTSTDNSSSGLGGTVTLKSAGVDQGAKTLSVFLQLHSDLWDAQDLVYTENIFIGRNIFYESSGYQALFWDNATNDIAVVDNHLKTGGGIGASIQDRAHSHLVIDGNNINANVSISTGTGTILAASISGTTLTITALDPGVSVPVTASSPTRLVGAGIAAGTRIVQQLTGTPNGVGTYLVSVSQTVASQSISYSRFSADAYCTFRNNVVGGLTVSGPVGQEGFAINDNHSTSLSGVTGTGNTTGSAMTTLIPNDTGNPEPGVSTPTATPATALDLIGATRPNPAPKGAKAFRITSATLTRQQALDLAAVNLNEPAGAGVNVVTLRWRAGAGETGELVTLTLTLNAA